MESLSKFVFCVSYDSGIVKLMPVPFELQLRPSETVMVMLA